MRQTANLHTSQPISVMHRPIMKEERLKFWNPERITTTGKSLRITQMRFNIIYIMRTNRNQGRI
ncbi:hypothetical protein C6525_22035 [Escherichia coli]|uniref:Uncharacterized protein n=1 Tax=Escherichia coli O145:NM TaxID=991919 RepID=A0A4P8C309_ECOLX|nr:hypothetical protein I3Y_09665 [Escherichia coli O145 str. RM9872]EFN9208413.1 hypothetical protein [Escherichia coli]QCH93962.1 hypothetical protein CCU01_014655 [Escherichia coli O145:NM]EFN9949283.1 hypothetical protein [Escherichia coli]EFO1729650.1 hypothetical protein [Escherichia coli]